jgi:hypothetical protein
MNMLSIHSEITKVASSQLTTSIDWHLVCSGWYSRWKCGRLIIQFFVEGGLEK